jgi:CheY-like chemotaxis protein
MGKMSEKRRTLLIVENEQCTREGMVELLERDGYHVHTAADEREAVASVRLSAPDLILIELGGTVDYLLAIGVRVRAEAGAGAGIPIVIYAEQAEEVIGEGEVVSMGDNQYATLPEDFQQLETLIGQLLCAA